MDTKKLKNEVREYTLALFETAQEKIEDIIDSWPLLLLLLAGLLCAILLAKPAPPDHVYLATGGQGGDLHALAKPYVEFFRERGITLELVETQGGMENLKLLRDKSDNVQAAFVQAGNINENESAGMVSLGSLIYQPIWFFYRGTEDQAPDEKIGKFLHSKLSIGPEGSGTHILAQRIIQLYGNGLNPDILSLPHAEAITALKKGSIDGLFIVNSIKSPFIQDLLHDPQLRLVNFVRAQAYNRQMKYLSVMEVPMGGFDLIRNFPPQNTQLLATTITLLVDTELHPAIQMLFLQAASAINGRGDYFAKIKEFPSYRDSSVPESAVSIRYHKSGPPLLMYYLPFWVADFIDRVVLLIVPLIVFAYPIISSLPTYRLKRLRAKLASCYGELKFLEAEITQRYQDSEHDQYLRRLNKLETAVLSAYVPKSITEYYFGLRTHIDFVRNKLARHAVKMAADRLCD